MGNLVMTPHNELTLFLERLNRFGVTQADFERVRLYSDQAKEVAEAMIRGRTTTLKRAKEIMEKGLVTPQQVVGHLGVRYSAAQLSGFETIPLSEGKLRKSAGKYILFPGAPRSIWEIRERMPEAFEKITDPWVERQDFFRSKKVDPRWYLIRTDTIPRSRGKIYSTQVRSIGKGNVMPWACEVVYLIVLYRMITKKHLFDDGRYVRCADVLPVTVKEVGDKRVTHACVFNKSGRISFMPFVESANLDYIGVTDSWRPKN